MNAGAQTIFALSSGRPPAAVAIVRISGPRAAAAVQMLAGRVPTARMATRATLRDHNGGPLDDGLVLWFPAPASATGEDVAEFHIHGGRAVLAALTAVLSSFEGVRPAEPGEFTRRAFENGKLDLTEAEGLDDLIHADTEIQRRQAMRQLGGLLGDRARQWRAQIIEAAALIEAGIDFSDEGDVQGDLMAPALRTIAGLHGEITEVLAAEGRGERLRDGLVVAIAGPPNVGKSTLINKLARRDVAIVSPYAGTTRDVIEVQLDLGGYPVTVIDTAGIRQSDDPIEQEGIRRAQARAAEADLVLWLSDGDGTEHPWFGSVALWSVRTKADLAEEVAEPGGSSFVISAESGLGVVELIAAVQQFAEQYFAVGETSLISRVRHRTLLQKAALMLHCSMKPDLEPEFVAEELRLASVALGRLLGRVDVEDVLGEIFGRFCIGK
ncbi:tRNA uridine-5-carboxymethylaminomethyl(34) synthesis GTPase MnmE [Rhodopseudomonas sp. HC1]|uniref:tRNA uridine-5-carboxymethylaminomethyl(34) synthesis GTPase MnmE n=1 Tax=Rhodopseudomonas infernalis TaxID=2897386 RepID=UPI001EE8E414|nr:tRNA uridine-5-carboxymethylaminomethyl(34) synthesis GTPase MnmE [Rhodopseudomonas infernalis]MCG6206147.1 tRNA uridine-5-carboxymethylaminomethyl(34) synthesis GTPase MnmE [Rhodopseudomonas infernalis]